MHLLTSSFSKPKRRYLDISMKLSNRTKHTTIVNIIIIINLQDINLHINILKLNRMRKKDQEGRKWVVERKDHILNKHSKDCISHFFSIEMLNSNKASIKLQNLYSQLKEV